jgi:hypothetical protein
MSGKLEAMKPQRKIEMFSGSYFAACTLGGIIACGPTHTMVTPLDLVRSDFSTKAMYSGSALALLIRETGEMPPSG